MKRLIWCLFGVMICLDAWSMCNLRQFRDDCELTISPNARPQAKSLVRCGTTYGYVRTADYDTLLHYQRVHMNLSLSMNNAYITAPCIPIYR